MSPPTRALWACRSRGQVVRLEGQPTGGQPPGSVPDPPEVRSTRREGGVLSVLPRLPAPLFSIEDVRSPPYTGRLLQLLIKEDDVVGL